MLCSDRYRCVARLDCTRSSLAPTGVCPNAAVARALAGQGSARVPEHLRAFGELRVHARAPSPFQYLCEDNPEYASQVGQHAHDGALQDLSPEAFARRMVCV